MRYSTGTLEQVRAASDIVDVIGASVPLKKNGANFVALCPFHKEKSPSFNVNAQKQIFHCFGCHKGGDVFKFIQEYENITFGEAVKRLAERARIPLQTESGGGDQQRQFLKETLLEIHEQITVRWQNALANEAGGQIARDYLEQRQVHTESVKQFRIGYAPELWDDTVNWARAREYDVKIVEQSGLILPREGGNGHYDRFRGRLIFPICDELGRVIGFSGRVLKGDEKTAKYVNSPETPLFTKGRVMFGLDKAKRAMLDAKTAIICEGQLDTIAIHRAGLANTVAPQGTALTADHIRTLKRYVPEVILCFDSDSAGEKAAVRSLDELLASGLAIRVAQVPQPHDPDSFIKERGPEAFQTLVNGAIGFFDFYLGLLSRNHDLRTDKGRLGVVQEMAVALEKTGNAVLRDTYAQKTAFKLGVTVEAVKADFIKARKPVRPRADQPPPEDELPTGTPEEEVVEPISLTPEEDWLLQVVFQNEEYVPFIMQHLDLNWLNDRRAKAVLTRRQELYFDEQWQGVAPMMDELQDPLMRQLVSEAACSARPITNAETLAKGTLERLRADWIKRRMTEMTLQLNHPELTAEQMRTIVEEQNRLRALKTSALQPVTSGLE